MRSPSDPIRTAWAGTLAIGAVGLIACAGATFRAMSPVSVPSVDLDWRPEPVTTEPDRSHIDGTGQMAAFDVRLWTAPERPVEEVAIAETPELAPPPPLRLVLLGIVSPSDPESSAFEAIVYDPDTDTIHIARTGTTIGSVTLGAIAQDSVLVVSLSGEVRLTMDTGEKQATRG